MTARSARPCGFSSGAFHFTSRAPGLAAVRSQGLTAIEFSAFDITELSGVEIEVRAGVTDLTVGVHGPVRAHDEDPLGVIDRLDALNVPVVMHPYTITDLSPWRALGSRLLIENSDSRKRSGQDVADLERIFAEVPEASMCLDVSHALDSGGTARVAALTEAFGARITQVHIGCDCGHEVPRDFEPELIHSTKDALSAVEPHGREVTIIAERRVKEGDLGAVASQARALHELARHGRRRPH